MREPILCYRCGQPAHQPMVEITSFGDPEPVFVPGGAATCTTPGCVDLDGSKRAEPLTPETMRRRADEAFMRRHRSFVEDR